VGNRTGGVVESCFSARSFPPFPLVVALFLLSGILLFPPFFSSADAAAVSGDVDAPASGDMTKEEWKLARRGAEEIEKSLVVVHNPVLQARVDTIVNRLRPHMTRDLPYDAKILDWKIVNAFALAGGPMYVTTGMLDFVKTDSELAGVVAHEMAHADRKHVIAQMARNNRMTIAAILIAIAGASEGSAAPMMLGGALQTVMMSTYSIEMEKEADAVGIDVMSRAGYNPAGMVTLQERLEVEKLKRPEFFNPSHPEAKERIAAAVRYMEENDIPLHRKYALGLLRPEVRAASGDIFLDLDGEAAWRGRDDAATAALFHRVANDLWMYLQLETAPYDVRVERLNNVAAFLIRGRTIAREDELPAGADSLESLRQGVHDALTRSRRSHPLANYFL